MTNKIVILDNSVELYEHYISDEKWEKTLSFPKGGLTFNISNGTIKFFAFEDYLYRNCIMSMQLPVYIVDKDGGVDGEYDDIGEISEILDRMFPNTSGAEVDLSAYLKKREAAATYQPIGDYALKSEIPDVTDFVTDEDLVEALDDYYTKDEVDELIPSVPSLSGYATIEYVDSSVSGKADSATVEQELATKLDVSAYTPCDLSDYYTSAQTESAITQAVSGKQDTLIPGDNIIISGNVISAIRDEGEFNPAEYYKKEDVDDLFQKKGDYVTEASMHNVLNDYTTKTWVENKGYVTISEMTNYITNLQEQINSLQSALEECCSHEPSGETIYRWITMTGENDYMCSGTTKYSKQKKQQSQDNGKSWTDVSPLEYKMGTAIEAQSTACGYQPITDYRWVTVPNDYVCKGNYCKYEVMKLQYSYDSGSTWVDSDPLQTATGSLVNCKNVDCGYSGCSACAEVKLLNDSETYKPDTTFVEYNDGAVNYQTTQQGWFINNSENISAITFDDCVTELSYEAFKYYYPNLVRIDLPSSLNRIESGALVTKYQQNVTNLAIVIVRATTPPLIDEPNSYGKSEPDTIEQYDNIISTSSKLRIYVPDLSVDLYKNDTKWSYFKRFIMPLSALNS